MTLNDVIGKDIFFIDNDRYNDDDIKRLSTENLEKLKLRITNNINSLSTVIKNKQIEYATGGEGCSADWYIKRKHILSLNQRVLPYVNILIKKRRQDERPLSEYFMNLAQNELPAWQYGQILNAAKNEMRLMREG